MAGTRTFSIIKPDATARNLTGAINKVIEDGGLRIVAQRRIHMTQAQAERFYDVHKERPFFGELVVSGAHANSVKMVADGAVDVAAIDYVSWRLARAHLAEAQALRIVTLTRPMPGLPFITQAAQHRDAIVAATAAAIDDLPAETRDALGIRGLWRSDAGDYEIVAEERRD